MLSDCSVGTWLFFVYETRPSHKSDYSSSDYFSSSILLSFSSSNNLSFFSDSYLVKSIDYFWHIIWMGDLLN